MSGKSKYKRVLLKLSGEALQGEGACIAPASLARIADQLGKAREMGVELAIVSGGGNIFRGLSGQQGGVDRTLGDTMGMLATMINSLALQSCLEQIGIPARVLAAVDMPKVAELITARRAREYLETGHVVILGGGTGNPFFTTDSAAALRAIEIGADILLKATKVDGIYTADPHTDPQAERFETITYSEALTRQLKVMDAAAFSLCMENNIPIMVFNFFKEDEIVRVLRGEPAGTLVSQ